MRRCQCDRVVVDRELGQVELDEVLKTRAALMMVGGEVMWKG